MNQERKGKERKGKERKAGGGGKSRGNGSMSKSSCLVDGVRTHANGFRRLPWTNAGLPH